MVVYKLCLCVSQDLLWRDCHVHRERTGYISTTIQVRLCSSTIDPIIPRRDLASANRSQFGDKKMPCIDELLERWGLPMPITATSLASSYRSCTPNMHCGVKLSGTTQAPPGVLRKIHVLPCSWSGSLWSSFPFFFAGLHFAFEMPRIAGGKADVRPMSTRCQSRGISGIRTPRGPAHRSLLHQQHSLDQSTVFQSFFDQSLSLPSLGHFHSLEYILNRIIQSLIQRLRFCRSLQSK